jgi:hypothetical protein
MLLNRVKTDLFALDLFSDPFDTSDRMSSEGKLHALPAGTVKCVDSRGALVLGCLYDWTLQEGILIVSGLLPPLDAIVASTFFADFAHHRLLLLRGIDALHQ